MQYVCSISDAKLRIVLIQTRAALIMTVVADIIDWHRGALASTRAIFANITPEQWTAPTPCEGWDVRALANHVVSGNLWAAELASGNTIEAVGDRFDGDVLGSEPLLAYDASAEAAVAAFGAPGALEAPCAVSYGPVPGEVYAGHRLIDVLIHGWDLAAATGQNTTLDPSLVAGCLAVVEPQAAMLRASGAFGDQAQEPTTDDPQAKLLAMLGRQS
jgi:uncharacterized protein (TIGR03086 family)